MAFYDEARIMEDADALSVAEYLGIEIRRAGKRHQIYCPGHFARLGKEDSSMGSCYLTNKGYHCYACDAQVSLPNMVMEIEDCSYKEALGIIADSLGGRELYTISGKYDNEEREQILKEQDLKILGLLPTVSFDVILNEYSSKEEIMEANSKNRESEDEEIRRLTLSAKYDANAPVGTTSYLAVHHQTISLKSIFQESPVEYYFVVRNKAKEAMDKYKHWSDCLANPTSNEFELFKKTFEYIGVDFDNNTIFDLKQLFTNWYARAKEIYLSITPKMAGQEEALEETNKEEKVKPKIRLDLFQDLP